MKRKVKLIRMFEFKRTNFQANVIRLRVGLPCVAEQNVLRFQIAMNNALLLESSHGTGYEQKTRQRHTIIKTLVEGKRAIKNRQARVSWLECAPAVPDEPLLSNSSQNHLPNCFRKLRMVSSLSVPLTDGEGRKHNIYYYHWATKTI